MLVMYDGVRFMESATVTKSEAILLVKHSIEDFEESKMKFIPSKDELNRYRDDELKALEVSIEKDGTTITLDADKESQDNIKIAILSLNENEETMWLTKDNNPITLTREDLNLALREVGKIKREIVFKYRALKDAL